MSAVTIIKCPKCAQSLPGNAPRCHFCGQDLGAVVRPVAAPAAQRFVAAGPAPWVWWAYFGISGYIAVSGVIEVFQAISTTKTKLPISGEEMGWGFGPILGVIFGLISVAIGIGLALRIEFFRGVSNFFCGLRIIFGVLGLLTTLPLIALIPGIGLLMFVMQIVNIATAALMIYLIGETD